MSNKRPLLFANYSLLFTSLKTDAMREGWQRKAHSDIKKRGLAANSTTPDEAREAGLSRGHAQNIFGTSGYQFRINPPEAALGLPTALKVSLADTTVPVKLGTLAFDSLMPDTAHGWYLFRAALDTVSLDITLGDSGCYGDNFDVVFEWKVFCTQQQLDAFKLRPDSAETCMQCSSTRSFKRGTANLNLASKQNSFTSDSCSLVWNLNVTNPTTQPTIDSLQLDLNLATGLVYQGATLTTSCGDTFELPPPGIDFVETNSGGISLNYMNLSIVAGGLNISPGCTFSYSLRLGLSGSTCDTLIGTPVNFVKLSGANVCDELFETGVTIAPEGHFSSINAISDSACCLHLPPPLVQHLCCGDTVGSIAYFNDSEDSLQIEVLYPFSDTIMAGPNSIALFDNLPVGSYILIFKNLSKGGIYSIETAVENHCFSFGLEADIVALCIGDTLELSPVIDIPSGAVQGLDYNYLWTVQGDTIREERTLRADSALSSGMYQITLNNGSCQASDSIIIQNTPCPCLCTEQGDKAVPPILVYDTTGSQIGEFFTPYKATP